MFRCDLFHGSSHFQLNDQQEAERNKLKSEEIKEDVKVLCFLTAYNCH